MPGAKDKAKTLLTMDDKTYNRITSIIELVLGVGGLLVSLIHAIPAYGPIGLVALVISIGVLILGLDKDT